MSKELSQSSTVGLTTTRKQVNKVLSTGQKISLTPQDERTLKSIYDYLAGFAKRQQIESLIEVKKREVDQLKNNLSPKAKLLMKEKGANATKAQVSTHGNNNNEDEYNESDKDKTKGENDKSDGEKQVEEYFTARDQLLKLEEKLKNFLRIDHKIGFKDLDAVIRSLGTALHRRQIEVSNRNLGNL